MPKQNRVNPRGELIAVAERGHFMGNRGILHDNNGKLTAKRWSHKHWIICKTEFKDRKRPLMTPGCYTELFFHDEVTALAAGHRPCCECRRDKFEMFKSAWLKGNPHLELGNKVTVNDIDNVLHRERVTADGQQVTFREQLAKLPDGVMLSIDEEVYLQWKCRLLRWTPAGYAEEVNISPATYVEVITPKSTCNALAAGYIPNVSFEYE